MFWTVKYDVYFTPETGFLIFSRVRIASETNSILNVKPSNILYISFSCLSQLKKMVCFCLSGHQTFPNF